MSKQGQSMLPLQCTLNLRINHRPCLSINDFDDALFYMSLEGSVCYVVKLLQINKPG